MDPLLSAMVLGFVLGMQHATDPDHLVAVATIVTRERRFVDGAFLGALWGIGHMTTLTIAGALVVGFHVVVGPQVRTGLELVVAAMLVLLGLWRLRDLGRGLDTVDPSHLAADHGHGHVERLHSHSHQHDGRVHHHPHLHPSRRLLEALGARRQLAPRAMLIGAVHGLAGSAAVSLLVLATMGSVSSAVGYLLVFGFGTVTGMLAFTAALAFPVSVALRFDRARRALAWGASLGSIAFGLFYAWRVM